MVDLKHPKCAFHPTFVENTPTSGKEKENSVWNQNPSYKAVKRDIEQVWWQPEVCRVHRTGVCTGQVCGQEV